MKMDSLVDVLVQLPFDLVRVSDVIKKEDRVVEEGAARFCRS